ncbi:DUF5667 domain-containing protein [Streptomyces sp. NPDC005876]|uniref:DUF5667 domain-containing protein n=1 Tax=Streptomyces sp. NPDC005876 TaxID=3157076 RepID=UPI003402DB8A
MIANVSAHRRANAFAQALEEQSDPDTAAEQPDTPAPAEAAADPTGQRRLVALAAGLDALPRPTLDPEVKAVQRAQLVAAFEAMLQEGTAQGEATDPSVPEQRRSRGAHRATPLKRFRPRSRLAKGLTAGGLSVGVAAGAFGSIAAASTDALPGDSLYGLKRGIEDFKLGLADGEADRGRAYLDLASTRLSEARRLLERDRGGLLDHESLGEIRRALTGMRHDAAEGHRLLSSAYARDPDSLGPLRTLSAFSRSHRETWGAVRDRLPVQLGDVSEQVSSVFDAIEQDVAPLRSLLPEPPAKDSGGDGERRGDSGPTTTDAPGSGRTAPPSTGGDDTPERGRTGSDRPSQPAESGSEDDGLLGGAGGLLDPPKDSAPSSPTGGSKSKTPVPEPDITLPPLIPGLLPGLGIEGEDPE